MSDSKSPQVSRTLLSILADFNKAVVWKVSTRPLVSQSSSLCTSPLVTVPSLPITTGIAVTFMFHVFFSIPQQGPGTYPSFRFLSILLCGQLVHQRLQFGRFCLFFLFFFLFFFVNYY